MERGRGEQKVVTSEQIERKEQNRGHNNNNNNNINKTATATATTPRGEGHEAPHVPGS